VIAEALIAATLVIPPAQAFALPSADTCVSRRALTFRLRPVADDAWARATVRVDGRLVKRLGRAGVTRRIRLRGVPRGRFVLSVSARTRGGQTATARRTYQTCLDTKPTVTVPPGERPTTLQVRDLERGSGAQAQRGREATVHYVIVAWSDGAEIDATWDRREPFAFIVGAPEIVIEGFDRGVEGMRLGGRREIIIPPDLGYGAEGSPPAVKGNETLIAVVDLVRVR
jgi:FKBP-type peptidyl-prolyl cis-trans isomerase